MFALSIKTIFQTVVDHLVSFFVQQVPKAAAPRTTPPAKELDPRPLQEVIASLPERLRLRDEEIVRQQEKEIAAALERLNSQVQVFCTTAERIIKEVLAEYPTATMAVLGMQTTEYYDDENPGTTITPINLGALLPDTIWARFEDKQRTIFKHVGNLIATGLQAPDIRIYVTIKSGMFYLVALWHDGEKFYSNEFNLNSLEVNAKLCEPEALTA